MLDLIPGCDIVINYSNSCSHENKHASSSEEREFSEYCDEVDLTLSEEKLKHSRNNACIALDEGDGDLLQTNNVLGTCQGTKDDHDSELEVCKQAELSASQTSNSSPVHKTHFDKFPDEILENIFCQLPLIDLLTSLSLVCKKWHRIISGEKFLLWKKRYYRYKYSFDSRSEIDSLIVQEQLHLPQTFPTQLCR